MSDESSLSFSNLVEQIYLAVEKSGLERSFIHFDARNIPESAVDNSFCISTQSRNTGNYRDNPIIRVEHIISLSMLFRIYPNQENTIFQHLNVEQDVMAALLNPGSVVYSHITYVSTNRSQIYNGEKYLITISFSCKADWDFSSVAIAQ